MNIEQMLDEAKKALELDTDYQLAKKLGVSTARITELRSGGKPTVYILTRLSVIMGQDPMKNIAMFQAENAKSESQRGFWRSFFSIAGLWIIIGGLLLNFSTFSPTAEAAGSRASIDDKRTLCEVTKKMAKAFMAIFGRYFTCNWTRKVFGLRPQTA